MEEIGLEQGLRKLRVWTKFMNNFSNKAISHLNYLPTDASLSGVFSWSETEEGFDFWSKVADKLFDMGCNYN